MSELLCFLFERYLLRLSVLLLPNDTERSKRTVTRICIFNLKTKQKMKNGIILWHKVCSQIILQFALGSLWQQPVGKTCCLWRRNRTMTDTFRKTKDSRQHCSCNLCYVSLNPNKAGLFEGIFFSCVCVWVGGWLGGFNLTPLFKFQEELI